MSTLKEIASSGLHSLGNSFDMVWSKLSPVILPLFLIIAFLGIGLIIVNYISNMVSTIIKKSNLDFVADKIVDPITKLTGSKINVSGLISGTVRWFLIATLLLTALDLAELTSVIAFFNTAIAYLPNIFGAAVIIIVGSLVANLAAYIVKLVTKNEKEHLTAMAKGAVNALAFIAALGQIAAPLFGALNQFIGQLSLTKLQSDVLLIGILVLILFASKGAITKTVDSLLKN